MTPAPVGLRCPDHSGLPQGTQRITQGIRRASYEGTASLATKTIIGLNVLVFLAQVGSGDVNGRSGWIFEEGSLAIRPSFDPLGGLAGGEWWRLVTAMFLHASVLHIAFNMWALWAFGGPLEALIGRGRFILLYFVSGIAGSAGAVLLSPDAVTVGASGAVFGIFGAVFVLEQQRVVAGTGALGIILLNLAITFVIPGISIGGHLGGLAGGALGVLALSRFGRGHAVYGRPGLVGVGALVLIGAASVLLAYWRVQEFVA